MERDGEGWSWDGEGWRSMTISSMSNDATLSHPMMLHNIIDIDMHALQQFAGEHTSGVLGGMGTYHRTYNPSPRVAFYLLFTAYACAALYTPIADCDETYNYLDPLHYLVTQSTGCQTWEYAPQYALRSYAYLLLHQAPLTVYSTFFPAPQGDPTTTHPKVVSFYVLRLGLALATASAFTYLYSGLRKAYASSHLPVVSLLGLAFGSGFFHAVPALLPSSSAMVALALGHAAALHGHYVLPIASVAFAAIWGWPFAAWAGGPLALALLAPPTLPGSEKGTWGGRVVRFGLTSAVVGSLLLGLLAAIDSAYYGHTVIPPLNIVMYNVLSATSEQGSELYGTEPWTYYMANGVLNFNLFWVLGLLGPLFVFGPSWATHAYKLGPPHSPLMALIASVWAWLGLMILQPHKEERFLYPIYPALVVSASFALVCLGSIGDAFLDKVMGRSGDDKSGSRRPLVSILFWSVVGAYVVLCISRSALMANAYGAPLSVYTHLPELEPEEGEGGSMDDVYGGMVCVGKEWYRFPSSWFLPQGYELGFVKSGFGGLLPGRFGPYPEGLSAPVENVNNMNREEPSTMVEMEECDYFVDLVLDAEEEDLSVKYPEEWVRVASYPFLDAERTGVLGRVLWIPGVSGGVGVWADYVLFERA